MKQVFVAGLIAVAATLPASASCGMVPAPDGAAGTLETNGRRLICQNIEIGDDAALQRQQLQLDLLQSRMRQLELQRRLDTLPAPAPIF